jgi:hypothetical protein
VEGSWQFTAPGRIVHVDVLTDRVDRPDEEFLHALLDGAPQTSAEQTLVIPTDDDLTHAFWLQAGEQHEFHAHVIRDGSALSLSLRYDDPADHAWAMHVLRSVAYQD